MKFSDLLKAGDAEEELKELVTWAKTVWGEARGEGYEGMVAVGWAIANRCLRRRKDVEEVCRAPLQFSCWNPDDPNRLLLDEIGFEDPQFVEAFGICCLIAAGRIQDSTSGADHYCGINIPTPQWAMGMKQTLVLGGYRFFRS